MRHQKFLVRMRFYPGLVDPTLYTMVGHVTRETRSYYHSADSYAEALKVNPNCPFLRLYLATVYTHIAAQRFTTSRHTAAVQALAFLSEYKSLRGESFSQEIHYNMGRFVHTSEFHT